MGRKAKDLQTFLELTLPVGTGARGSSSAMLTSAVFLLDPTPIHSALTAHFPDDDLKPCSTAWMWV